MLRKNITDLLHGAGSGFVSFRRYPGLSKENFSGVLLCSDIIGRFPSEILKGKNYIRQLISRVYQLELHAVL